MIEVANSRWQPALNRQLGRRVEHLDHQIISPRHRKSFGSAKLGRPPALTVEVLYWPKKEYPIGCDWV
jgi:hypothetical protein